MSSRQKLIKEYAWYYSMDSTDIENQASEIAYAVEDLRYQVESMRDALKAVRDAAEEGLDELSCL